MFCRKQNGGAEAPGFPGDTKNMRTKKVCGPSRGRCAFFLQIQEENQWN